MRCPDCNKFVSLELDENVEVYSEEVDPEGHVTVEARIVRTCADCSQDLKEANFILEGDIARGVHHGKGHELQLECEAEATERAQPGRTPRYTKTFFGVSVTVTITCSCGEKVGVVTLQDEVGAGAMDELA